jgi:hypothetical protein
MKYLQHMTHMNVKRSCQKKKLIASGSWLAAAATVWLALAAVWPVRADAATEKVEKTRRYMLADPDRTALKHSVTEGKLTIELPEKATDEIDSVLCIEVKK